MLLRDPVPLDSEVNRSAEDATFTRKTRPPMQVRKVGATAMFFGQSLAIIDGRERILWIRGMIGSKSYGARTNSALLVSQRIQ